MNFALLTLLTSLSQTVTDTALAAPVIQTAGGLGAFGLVAWLLRRVFTHTIPRLASDFKEALVSQQKLFSTELEQFRELFTEEVTRQREDFKEELRLQREDFKGELRRERETFANRLDQIKTVVDSLPYSLESG